MARTPVELSEKGFEEYIEEHLLNSGYIKGNPADYNREFALDAKILFEFLEDTQPKKMDKLKEIYKDQHRFKILSRLNRELNNRGMIDVLRHGIKDYGVYLDLAYFQPASKLNEEIVRLYEKNRISVTRQVRYSTKSENSIDMLICVNGLPAVVLELKNPFTGQTYEDAIMQYKQDRNPNELLFQFKKRAIVFFAADTSEVYMTTRLAGDKTFFLPFNKGKDGGRGNPDNPNGFKTAYLWEKILQKDSLMDILKRFVFIETEEKKDIDGKTYISEKVIFPRYHQLDVVRKLEADAREKGVGTNYLVQHSAGSGKTNSISWLAHRLANLHDDDDNSVFDSVIVITDRRVLDKQLQESIYQLEHKHGVVQKIDKDSNQLVEALKSGTRIIISTLQKFPFIIEKVGELENRKYAVIIDEAHSSSAGENMASLREVLSASSLEEAARLDEELEGKGYDPEEEILNTIKKRGRQPNISFFAFTATPKAKTLEMFGTIGEDGLPHPFHLYSMRQAIEEGFILDVLQNYVTYETYFKLAKKIEDDPAFDKAKATKALTRYVSLHPHNIAQKTEIMVEHFRNVTSHKIGGRAKAMVVTSSRLHAVRYKHAFDEYIKKKGYKGLKTLVAFSGIVRDEGIEYTESDMNGFKESELPERFATDEYQVLLVAEKYQTGFDQPLLHTMYVDKKLSGVKAVQTLSRLNRTCPGKEDTFVLDFVNKAEDIQEAFKPYYEATIVEEVTEPNLLYDIQSMLDAYGVYIKEELDKFAYIYFKPKEKKTSKDRAALNSLIDMAVERFKKLDEEHKEDFSSQATKCVRLYSFILQITPFEDVELHKLYVYLTYLLKKLRKEKGSTIHLADEIALEYYTTKKTFEGSISLGGNYENVPVSPPRYGGGKVRENQKEYLSSIIERLNERFGTDFTKADQLSVEQIKEDFAADEDLVLKAKTNTIDDFRLAFEKVFINKVVDRMDQNRTFFTRVLDDEQFRNALMEYMLVETYEKLSKGA
ncbi:putative type I restriction-modification system (HsdR) [Tepidanaerobacter acetatoxydans Re1]|uniref:Putative type I restriction-modification system (HsdR) n=1 Tax=Tepidanaerobacter acetatoxydans (strain DSM 21804 / JCM 16047 / Re1) TaxID=1209989 RepID=F4LS06_TEPAE|nr:type I restriction endonuclease [Tepidanaerobacter acetatoxydans]AEE92345.1 Restriction endonuclease, type I, EcoRI, R subunit/Type III [Tepidanaerobacter acetatoxydans Re1]CCP27233.1 putative type I restriction-modification system (HsdR) [Tepidanaerobacter acetatoxydans Re1]